MSTVRLRTAGLARRKEDPVRHCLLIVFTLALSADVRAAGWSPTRPGDYDEDGDVDLTDFAQFGRCLRGTGSAGIEAGRRAFDADGDVDVLDLGRFALSYTGPTGG